MKFGEGIRSFVVRQKTLCLISFFSLYIFYTPFYKTKNPAILIEGLLLGILSGWQDSNLRPSRIKAGRDQQNRFSY